MSTTLAALFDSNTPTGANPVTECLDVTGVQTANVPGSDYFLRIHNSFPSRRFIANYSQGFLPTCPTASSFVFVPPLERAANTGGWIKATSNKWSDFLIATAAGNCFDDKSAQVYPGHGSADYNSLVNIANGLRSSF